METREMMVSSIKRYVSRALQSPVVSTGGTDNARYCYAVWLRHLIRASACRDFKFPRSVMEIGPGDSIGAGLAALLSGVQHYHAVDAYPYARPERNVKILDELIALFRRRASVPDDAEFLRVKPKLADYRFPTGILDDSRLAGALAEERLSALRASLSGERNDTDFVHYTAPWKNRDVMQGRKVDMVFSQAVMQVVADLPCLYRMMYEWLAFGGLMSHQIDLKWYLSPGEWNQHLTFSSFRMFMFRFRQPYSINRARHSEHIELMRKCGFDILTDDKVFTPSRLKPEELQPRFRKISNEDLTISGAFIQCLKPPEMSYEVGKSMQRAGNRD